MEHFQDAFRDGWKLGQEFFGTVLGFFAPLLGVVMCIAIVGATIETFVKAARPKPDSEEPDQMEAARPPRRVLRRS